MCIGSTILRNILAIITYVKHLNKKHLREVSGAQMGMTHVLLVERFEFNLPMA